MISPSCFGRLARAGVTADVGGGAALPAVRPSPQPAATAQHPAIASRVSGRRGMRPDGSASLRRRYAGRNAYALPRYFVKEVRVEKVDRARFLRLGAASALGAAGVAVVSARPAAAALPAPNPVGDDVGFFSFAVVAEMASMRCYQGTLGVKGWSPAARRTVSEAIEAKGAHIRRINHHSLCLHANPA